MDSLIRNIGGKNMKFKSKLGTRLLVNELDDLLNDGLSIWEQTFNNDVRLLSVECDKHSTKKKKLKILATKLKFINLGGL